MPILRGLVDEMVCIIEKYSEDFGIPHMNDDLLLMVHEAIWEANNEPDENGEPIWWPKHEEIDGKLCLIEERLDIDKNRIEMRIVLEY